MTRIELDRRRLHALCQEALEFGVDGAILGRYLVPAWFRSPGRRGGFLGDQRTGDLALNGKQCACPGWGKIARKIFEKGVFAEPEEPVHAHDSRARSGVLKFCSERGKILAGIRSASRHVDKRRDVGVIPGLADNRSGK